MSRVPLTQLRLFCFMLLAQFSKWLLTRAQLPAPFGTWEEYFFLFFLAETFCLAYHQVDVEDRNYCDATEDEKGALW